MLWAHRCGQPTRPWHVEVGLEHEMCFSPQADLVGGIVIGDWNRHRPPPAPRARACLSRPSLALACHQVVEAFVWWGLQGRVPGELGRSAMWVYLVFAFCVLPVFVPAAIMAIEPTSRRRWLYVTLPGGRNRRQLHPVPGAAARPHHRCPRDAPHRLQHQCEPRLRCREPLHRRHLWLDALLRLPPRDPVRGHQPGGSHHPCLGGHEWFRLAVVRLGSRCEVERLPCTCGTPTTSIVASERRQPDLRSAAGLAGSVVVQEAQRRTTASTPRRSVRFRKLGLTATDARELPHDRQAEPGPSVTAATTSPEALEGLRQFLRAQARAFVEDVHLNE